MNCFNTQSTANQCFNVAGLILGLLATIAFTINHFFYQYKGNNYFPPGVFQAGICLLLMVGCTRFYLGKHHVLYKFSQSILKLYLVMGGIALLTNAVQLTPFLPIDKQLIATELFFGIDLSRIIAWTAKHPLIHLILSCVYDSLTWQMTFLPIMVTCFGGFTVLRQYFCFMLISAILGFTIYYFFPTLAPASNIVSTYFRPEQYATGIKFTEIHHHLYPSTMEGGMIAFPSFHAIWAWFCLYLVRPWPIIFFLLLPVNLLLVLSCVLLGWHYPIDIIGSILIILFTHAINNYRRLFARKLKDVSR